MKKIILAAVILLITVSAVYAQQADESPAAETITDETDIILDDTAAPVAAETEESRFFTTWDFIKVILILVAVILVIYAIFYALKKTGGLKYQNNEVIRLLGSQSLTQNASVHLIEVGARYYLVGCGDSTVTHIADIDDKESVDELMLKNPPKEEQKKSFADLFNFRLGGNRSEQTNLQERIKNNNKFMHDQAERLKKM